MRAEPIFYTPTFLTICLAIGLIGALINARHPKCEECGLRKGHGTYCPNNDTTS